MREVKVIGVGMTQFGKFLDRGLKNLGGEAIREALADAAIASGQLEAAFVGNAMAGLMTGQECIRGQVILHALGLRSSTTRTSGSRSRRWGARSTWRRRRSSADR